MSGRRRHQRFFTGGSYEGSLRIRREVVVDGPGEDGTLSVVSDVPGVPEEILTLDLVAQRSSTSLMVQVIDSRPVVVDGAMRHTLRLMVLEGLQRRDAETMWRSGPCAPPGLLVASTPSPLDLHDVMAVLARDVDVRLLNVSASGCLIESRRRIEAGTAAALRLVVEGDEYGDDVIVARCSEVRGAGATYHVGVEFLWTTPPGRRSLRRMAVRLRQLVERGALSLALEPRHAM